MTQTVYIKICSLSSLLLSSAFLVPHLNIAIYFSKYPHVCYHPP